MIEKRERGRGELRMIDDQQEVVLSCPAVVGEGDGKHVQYDKHTD
jgi:hypothetical protein